MLVVKRTSVPDLWTSWAGREWDRRHCLQIPGCPVQAGSGPPLPPPLWAPLSCSLPMCPLYPLAHLSPPLAQEPWRPPRRSPPLRTELTGWGGHWSRRRHTAALWRPRSHSAALRTERELREGTYWHIEDCFQVSYCVTGFSQACKLSGCRPVVNSLIKLQQCSWFHFCECLQFFSNEILKWFFHIAVFYTSDNFCIIVLVSPLTNELPSVDTKVKE